MACNQKHGIASYGWLDGNPAHLMTTADGTGTTKVLRQISREKTAVNAPISIQGYNFGMQAVDRIDQLMRLFSLAK